MRALSLLLLIGLVAACSGGEEPADHGLVEITVVTWKPNDPAAWDVALERFHARHPGIRVKLEIGPNNSTQLHDLLTQKLRNRDASVDAFLMDVIWTPEFARAGWAAPLDDRFSASDRQEFFPGCIAADTLDGSIYGVAFNTDSGLLYYRTDLVDAPPRTWTEMVELIEKHREPGLHGYSAQLKQYEGLVCNLLEFVHSNGGDLAAPDSPAAIEAVRFVRDRIVDGAAPRGVLTYEEQESLDLFRTGGAIFHRNWPYAWAMCEESQIAGRVGIAVLPTFREGRNAAALGGWRFGISRFSRRADEAWTFIEYMTGEEMQRHFAVEAGKAPSRRALYADPAVLAANPHFAALAPVFETAVPRPRSPIYPQISHILQRYLHAAISNRESDLPALARDAANQLAEALRKIR